MNEIADRPESGLSLQQIQEYWRKVSSVEFDKFGLRPTGRDPFLQRLIEREIADEISGAEHVLDVGCGEGTSTLNIAGACASMTAVDLAESHVARAAEAAKGIGQSKIRWDVKDVLQDNLRLLGEFDCVYAIRCLINLGSWENQQKALHNMMASLRPGGLLVLSEGWSEEWHRLNELRRACGLADMTLVPHNTLIDRKALVDSLGEGVEGTRFRSLGLYMILSRVLQPAVKAPEPPEHLDRINQVAAELMFAGVVTDDLADFDYAGVLVVEKAL